MKKIGKEIMLFILTLFAFVIIGYFLLVIAYTLPTDKIADNVQDSLIVFNTEGSYPELIPGILRMH